MNKKLSSRQYDIDILKCIGMFLVMWAHFVCTGTYAYEIPGVINGHLSRPILDGCNLVRIDDFFYHKFHIQAGVVGVCLFFMISGYFIPKMQDKYNSGNFPKVWLKQALRIVPTTIACVLINGIVVYTLQGIKYSLKDYIVTCIYGGGYIIKNSKITMGVTWYLQVLSFMYFISDLIRKYSIKTVYFVYGIFFMIMFAAKIMQETSMYWIYKNLSYLAVHSGVILIGIGYSLSKGSLLPHKILRILFHSALTLLLQKSYNSLYNVDDTYSEKNTYFAVFLIIIFIESLYFFIKKLELKTLKILTKFIISKISDIFLPFYLVHVHFGLLTMYYLSMYGLRQRYCLVLGVVVSFVVASAISLVVKVFYKYSNKFVKALISFLNKTENNKFLNIVNR